MRVSKSPPLSASGSRMPPMGLFGTMSVEPGVKPETPASPSCPNRLKSLAVHDGVSVDTRSRATRARSVAGHDRALQRQRAAKHRYSAAFLYSRSLLEQRCPSPCCSRRSVRRAQRDAAAIPGRLIVGHGAVARVSVPLLAIPPPARRRTVTSDPIAGDRAATDRGGAGIGDAAADLGAVAGDGVPTSTSVPQFSMPPPEPS